MKKSSFFHAQRDLAQSPGLGGGGQGLYLPGQAHVDIHIQQQACISPDHFNTQQLHLQPTSKIPSVPVHLSLMHHPKCLVILGPPTASSTQHHIHLPPTYHQPSQCLVLWVVPYYESFICWQICHTHQKSHVIAIYRATGV